ncbi:glycosyltransferase family 2 protein [Pseudomonas viridiflava]|uniref:glycosyltransferase family 2 protein n=1 Tax=Pseudomonas viridiflava TaxID=33069 RepID=UPI000F010FCF|nr:glycosyltransferase family 2 protein [Pseudomonas viridiflava]QXG50211.1 glycosyltransferase family 2 protein [Pseudomonas viridiflava]
MCTYNGATYLREQLDSFQRQTITNWTLYVSDDASSDNTLEILAEYQIRWGSDKLLIFNGPCQGFAENFVSLLQREEVRGEFFSFSDQDDIWFSDKLERALSKLKGVVVDMPSMYCSRTRLTDADGRVIGCSPLFERPPAFENALVQSIAGANTMVINRAARALLLQLPKDVSVVAHDWLTYLLITGSGGTVIYDADPCLDYRQHDGNVIGANASLMDQLSRFRGMLSGRFVHWNDLNVNVLKRMEAVLSDHGREALACFDNGRKQQFFKRVAALKRVGIYRQTRRGNISLFLASWLGRI